MRSWKNQWKKELDVVVTQLREDVKNAPICVSEKEKCEGMGSNEHVFPRFKHVLKVVWSAFTATKWRRVAACCVASVIGLSIIGMAIGVGFGDKPIVQTSAAAFTVEINPKAVFVVGEDGAVQSVVAGNREADLILASKKRLVTLIGKTPEEALTNFVDYAAKLGYVNFSDKDAVRVSFCSKNGQPEKITENLKTYFRQKGSYTAVVEENLDPESFCQRAGISTVTSVQDIIADVLNSPALYSEKQAKGKTLEELKVLFREYVPIEGIQSAFESVVKGSLAYEERKTVALAEIKRLNEEIETHQDNPAYLFKDYWTVQEIYSSKTLTGDFEVKMQMMASALAAYEAAFGVTIDSVADLSDDFSDYVLSILQEVGNSIAGLTKELFVKNLNVYTASLKEVGIDLRIAQKYCEGVETKEEYEKMTYFYDWFRFYALSKEYREEYMKPRDVISESQYDAFEINIKAQYGSMSAYWSYQQSRA